MAMNITDPAIVNRMVLDKVHSRGVLFIVSVALWAGFMAGVVQESLKYLWVRKSSYVGTLNIGLGFGVAEAFTVNSSNFPYADTVSINCLSRYSISISLSIGI